MTAVLAVATILEAGLTILPVSIQNAQANPCSVTSDDDVSEAGEGEAVYIVIVIEAAI